ncbi:CASP-like protein 4D1 [Hevea brasiliensis]|uniref:CASP-like protein 4D1 n=1 Tax=Hevea brasiliensis TaxID=3981 RepID=UPI0025FF8C5E|nr:CASP-like protein 4D1 [Hevea brasiliensis]
MASCFLRVLTSGFLLASLIVLTTNTATSEMLMPIVLPMSFTLYHIATGNKLMGDVKSYLDFLGDQIISYILATGAAVGFGATKDMKSIFAGSGNVDEFFNKGYDSASLLLLGFVCTAILLVWKILA